MMQMLPMKLGYLMMPSRMGGRHDRYWCLVSMIGEMHQYVSATDDCRESTTNDQWDSFCST
jgi:hypothetical protein